MLSRIAGNCYWLARYLERAENNCRLLRAMNRQTLLPEYDRSTPLFLTALAVTDDLERFKQQSRETSALAVLDFMITSRDNSSSIVSCILSVRENARTARHTLTASMWEAVNGAWLEALALARDGLTRNRIDDTLDWAQQASNCIRGAARDLMRGEVPAVIDLGQAVERADFTARLISTLIRTLPVVDPDNPPPPGTANYRNWLSLIEAADIMETWRTYCPTRRIGMPALRLLIANPHTTRSLLASAREMQSALTELTTRDDSPAVDLASNLVQHLLKLDADDDCNPESLAADIDRTTEMIWAFSDRCIRDHLSIPDNRFASQFQTQK